MKTFGYLLKEGLFKNLTALSGCSSFFILFGVAKLEILRLSYPLLISFRKKFLKVPQANHDSVNELSFYFDLRWAAIHPPPSVFVSQ